MRYTKLAVLFLFVVTFGLSGCASFEKEELARVESLPVVYQHEEKPSVFIDFSFFRGKPEENPNELPQLKEKIQPIVESAFDKSGIFSEYTFDSDRRESSDYVLNVKAYNHGNNGAAFVSGFLCGFTFGIIPGSATDRYTVEVALMDSEGKVLSKRVNDDAIQTWIGIWFVPMMGHTPQKALTNTLENQIITALIELYEDGAFRNSARASD